MLEYLGIGSLDVPADAKDVTKAVQMEVVRFALLFRVSRPCFASIEEAGTSTHHCLIPLWMSKGWTQCLHIGL